MQHLSCRYTTSIASVFTRQRAFCSKFPGKAKYSLANTCTVLCSLRFKVLCESSESKMYQVHQTLTSGHCPTIGTKRILASQGFLNDFSQELLLKGLSLARRDRRLHCFAWPWRVSERALFSSLFPRIPSKHDSLASAKSTDMPQTASHSISKLSHLASSCSRLLVKSMVTEPSMDIKAKSESQQALNTTSTTLNKCQ